MMISRRPSAATTGRLCEELQMPAVDAGATGITAGV